MRKSIKIVFCLVTSLLCYSGSAEARGGSRGGGGGHSGGSSHSSSHSPSVARHAPAHSTHAAPVRPATGDHSVRGYVKKDGTYVAPHHATNPNGTKADNYSTKGNVNPYTGKVGSVAPASTGSVGSATSKSGYFTADGMFVPPVRPSPAVGSVR
jgi:hypothetical protein